jgi:diaminopimelate epimerase
VEAELGRPTIGGRLRHGEFEFELVEVGNPHAVTFVDDPEGLDVAAIGGELQAEFPDGANVEFARVVDGMVEMRVWERGVGETLACGTGMVAVAAVAMSRFELDAPIPVQVRGGRARVDFRDRAAWIIGPADYSFRGSVGER